MCGKKHRLVDGDAADWHVVGRCPLALRGGVGLTFDLAKLDVAPRALIDIECALLKGLHARLWESSTGVPHGRNQVGIGEK